MGVRCLKGWSLEVSYPPVYIALKFASHGDSFFSNASQISVQLEISERQSWLFKSLQVLRHAEMVPVQKFR